MFGEDVIVLLDLGEGAGFLVESDFFALAAGIEGWVRGGGSVKVSRGGGGGTEGGAGEEGTKTEGTRGECLLHTYEGKTIKVSWTHVFTFWNWLIFFVTIDRGEYFWDLSVK